MRRKKKVRGTSGSRRAGEPATRGHGLFGAPIVAVGLKFLSGVLRATTHRPSPRRDDAPDCRASALGETGRAFIRSGTYIRNLGGLNFLQKKQAIDQDASSSLQWEGCFY